MTSRIHRELTSMVSTWRPRTLSAPKLESKARQVLEYYRNSGYPEREEILKWFMGKVFRAKVHSAREKDEWRPRRNANLEKDER